MPSLGLPHMYHVLAVGAELPRRDLLLFLSWIVLTLSLARAFVVCCSVEALAVSEQNLVF